MCVLNHSNFPTPSQPLAQQRNLAFSPTHTHTRTHAHAHTHTRTPHTHTQGRAEESQTTAYQLGSDPGYHEKSQSPTGTNHRLVLHLLSITAPPSLIWSNNASPWLQHKLTSWPLLLDSGSLLKWQQPNTCHNSLFKHLLVFLFLDKTEMWLSSWKQQHQTNCMQIECYLILKKRQGTQVVGW